jgi:hypothetical protein
MNIIDGKMSELHKYGRGYRWYNTEDGISRWSITYDLIPEPKVYSLRFIREYGNEEFTNKQTFIKTPTDSLGEQLTLIARVNIGIRRKIVYLERYIKNLKKNKNGDEEQG